MLWCGAIEGGNWLKGIEPNGDELKGLNKFESLDLGIFDGWLAEKNRLSVEILGYVEFKRSKGLREIKLFPKSKDPFEVLPEDIGGWALKEDLS